MLYLNKCQTLMNKTSRFESLKCTFFMDLDRNILRNLKKEYLALSYLELLREITKCKNRRGKIINNNNIK